MNMHDQFMGMNTIQQQFPSCLPAFYALAIPMSCYISNVFNYLLHAMHGARVLIVNSNAYVSF